MKYLFIFLIALTLFACADQPISSSLVADTGGNTPLGKTLIGGLQDAAFNLDNAVAVGALDANDPAPGCVHGVLQQAGVEVPVGTPAAKSFTPKVNELIGLGSVLYIRAQQAKKLAGGGLKAPAECKALIGQFVIDAAQAGQKALPGGGLLPSISG